MSSYDIIMKTCFPGYGYSNTYLPTPKRVSYTLYTPDIDADINDLRENIACIDSKRVEGHNALLKYIKDSENSRYLYYQSLESAINKIKAKIDKKPTEMSPTDKINQLETQLRDSEARVNHLETLLETQLNASNASNAKVNQLETQLNSLFDKFETLTSELNQLKNQTPQDHQTPSESPDIINIEHEVDQGLAELIKSDLENTTSDSDMDEWGVIDAEQ